MFSEDEIRLIRSLLPDGATDTDLKLLLTYSQRTGLDPLLRQVWLNKRRGKPGQPIATIDGLRTVAVRSGEYLGQTKPEWAGADGVWHDVWTEDKPPAAARIGVYRKGFAEPLYAVARYSDYVQMMSTDHGLSPNSMWQKMAANQTLKCAEALALRKAFPEVLSGIYSEDEMAQATADNVVPFPEAQAAAMAAKRVAGSDVNPDIPPVTPEAPKPAPASDSVLPEAPKPAPAPGASQEAPTPKPAPVPVAPKTAEKPAGVSTASKVAKTPPHATDQAAVSALLEPVRRTAKRLGVIGRLGGLFKDRYGHIAGEATAEEALEFAAIALTAPEGDAEAWLQHMATAQAKE